MYYSVDIGYVCFIGKHKQLELRRHFSVNKFLINPVFIMCFCIKYTNGMLTTIVFTLLSFDKLLLYVSFSY